MNTAARDPAVSAPLVFLAFGSTLMLGSLVGAGYCAAQAWHIEADAIGWLAAGLAFLLVAGAVAPMMVGLGYGNAEIRRLLRFYTSPVRIVHKRRNRPVVFSGRSSTLDDEEDARAA
jgi:hypothetical protein